MLCQQSGPSWDLLCITHQRMSACGLSLLQQIQGLVLNNGKMHPHEPSHRLPHLQSTHTREKKQTTALRQLAKGQPAKGVGERHTYRERVKSRKVLT